jgi:chitinase
VNHDVGDIGNHELNSGPVVGLDDQYHFMGNADFHVAMAEMVLKGFPVAHNANNSNTGTAPAPIYGAASPPGAASIAGRRTPRGRATTDEPLGAGGRR